MSATVPAVSIRRLQEAWVCVFLRYLDKGRKEPKIQLHTIKLKPSTFK